MISSLSTLFGLALGSGPGLVAATAALAVATERIAYKPIRRYDRIVALLTAIGVSFLLQNLARVEGGWSWRVNWQAIQREMESLTGFDSLPTDWSTDLPTLFIRGAKSDYVGSAETDVIQRHFSNAEIATIEGAGHWLHAEQPAEFARLALDFLNRE